MSLSTPSQITVPFANSGTRNDIPASADNSAGLAGYDLGFPPITTVAKLAGGLPPRGADFNGMFYDVTEAIRYLEAGGQFPYNSAFSSAVGGYPLGALVMRSDGSGLWKNFVANNTTNPEGSDASGWTTLSAGITGVTMTSANYTLTNLQAANDLIIISGALTANLNLIFPTFSKKWTVINNTFGAYTVTCKTAAGTGIATSGGGQSTDLYGDGTNLNIKSGSSLNPLFVGAATKLGHAVNLSDFPSLLTPSGYVKFPGIDSAGNKQTFIFQWMSVTDSGSGARTRTYPFPITFPNTCLRSWAIDNGSSCIGLGCIPASTSQATLYIAAGAIGLSTSVATTGSFGGQIFAIGY